MWGSDKEVDKSDVILYKHPSGPAATTIEAVWAISPEASLIKTLTWLPAGESTIQLAEFDFRTTMTSSEDEGDMSKMDWGVGLELDSMTVR